MRIKSVFLFSLALFLTSCSNSTDKKGVCLKVNLVSDPTSLDPLLCRNLSSLFVARHLHDGLFRYQDEKVVTGLAERYEVFEEGKKYRIYLKEAYYSDGSLIKASDFVKTAAALLTQDIPADYIHLFYVVKNAQSIKEKNEPLETLGLVALDDRTLEYELEYPHADLPGLMTQPIFFPRKEGTETQVYSGPFILKSHLAGSKIVLIKNPYYHDKNHVSLKMLEGYFMDNEAALLTYEQERLDYIGSPMGTLPQEALEMLQQKGVLEKKPMLSSCFIRVNTERAPLDDKIFRRALKQSISSERIVKGALMGYHIKSETYVPKELHLIHPEIPQEKMFSIEQINHPTRPIYLRYSMADTRMQRVALIVKDCLESSLGISVQLVPKESKAYFQDLRAHDFDMIIGSWIADIADAENFLEIFFDKKRVQNATSWEDPEYQFLMLSARQNPKKKNQLLGEAESLLLEESPIIPLFQFNMLYAKSKKLEGVSLNGFGTLDFSHAYFKP